ncbi:MAG TPA: hypothetical protein VFD36_11240, partial [Kofleriaceae bacterium]|nr:hypothetical protein [Kofleriaceae bacterium]
YRLDAIDPAALGGRPVLVCAHRNGAIVEPRAASRPAGHRTWQLDLDLAGWQPRGPIDVYAITPRWTLRPATVVDGTTTVDVETPGRHHVLLCDRIECFLAGTFSR